jgi:hypothetical protein
MRKIPEGVADHLDQPQMMSFYLVDIGMPGIAMQYTSLPYDITFNGKLFKADNGLVEVDPPRISEVLDKDTYAIKIADPTFEIRDAIDSFVFTGSNVEVFVGCINTFNYENKGVPPGRPYPDAIKIYGGYVDNVSYSITPDEETFVTVECASPMAAFDLTRTLLTSRNYLRNKFNDDSSYDQILVGSSEVNLLWGKTED